MTSLWSFTHVAEPPSRLLRLDGVEGGEIRGIGGSKLPAGEASVCCNSAEKEA